MIKMLSVDYPISREVIAMTSTTEEFKSQYPSLLLPGPEKYGRYKLWFDVCVHALMWLPHIASSVPEHHLNSVFKNVCLLDERRIPTLVTLRFEPSFLRMTTVGPLVCTSIYFLGLSATLEFVAPFVSHPQVPSD